MKVLCLHGMGTNSEILKSQTASFRSMLPSHLSFEFMDGEYDCDAADGISEVYPGPYLCWYPFPPTIQNVGEAHEMIWDIINEEGPFDAVMGFSQGAALAASILLHHQIEKPLEPPPFRLAILICGSLPFSINEESGFDLTTYFATRNDPSPGDIEQWKCRATDENTSTNGSYFNLLKGQTPAQRFRSSPLLNAGSSSTTSSVGTPQRSTSPDSSLCYSPPTPPTPYMLDTEDFKSKEVLGSSLAARIGAISLTAEVPESKIRRFHPSIDSARISIPTAHIYGKNDPYFSQSLELVNMCQRDLVSVLDHGGAHEVPRSAAVSKAIAAIIEKTITRSELML